MNDQLLNAISLLNLQKETATLIPKGGDWLDYDFETNPEDFLERAEQDYEIGGSATSLNSITNSKRAIRCQIDKVLNSLGFDATSMKIKQKVSLLNNLGILAPRILRKVDNPRNLLEHEYKSPSLQEVEDALDLAALFIEATNRSIKPIGSDFSIATDGDVYPEPYNCHKNELIFHFSSDSKKFKIWPEKRFFKHPNSQVLSAKKIDIIFITPKEPIFADLIRIAVNIEKTCEEKTRQSLNRFFDALEKT